MAADRQKQLQHAERLLKQGKVQAAMLELERLADGAPNDVLTLNRIGDLLAKQGRKDEAIRFYNKIAEQFTNSGFLPKAVAIHKKVLRLNPNFIQSLVALGELYFQQKLPGEARTHMLRAADQYLHARNFTKAREVYERLVAAEPDDPRHRARLAEARAAEGETGTAGEELLQLADTLFASGNPEEAERTYHRAHELLPDREEPVVGLVRSLGEQGRNDEALALLDKAEKDHGGSTLILGERVLRFELAGRGRDAVELLKLPFASEIADDLFVRIFRYHRDHDGLDSLWKRLDPVFERWRAADQLDRLRTLLEGVVEIEPEGHVPALRRLLEVNRTRSDSIAIKETLENLVRACHARGLTQEVQSFQEQLAEISPGSAVLAAHVASQDPVIAVVQEETTEATPEKPSPVSLRADMAEGDPPIEAEAPAVPLNRADEEYVSGRLTQTEILEKYGLREQALQQVLEVTEKFPGHVPAQQKLVELLREGSAPRPLQSALVALALARRAEGDSDGAKAVCGEACAIGSLDDATTRMLAQLGLVDAAEALQTAEPDRAPVVELVAEEVSVEPSPEAAVAEASIGHDAAPHDLPTLSSHDGAVLIDFDDDDEDDKEVATAEALPVEPAPLEQVVSEAPVEVLDLQSEPAATPSADGAKAPGDHVLEEISGLIDDGNIGEARRRLDALETLGWVTADLIELKQKVEALESEQAGPVLAEAGSAAGEDEDIVDDDDLSAITAALEGELFADDAEPVSPEPESEQSLEEVFAAFKEQVDREVDDEDYRTHYDLGIAYKEMGLLDEAIAQFEQAVPSPEFGRESYTMLALCHRERDETDAAAHCYRQAIDSSPTDGEALNSLRYELAELLLNTGDRKGALDEFRHLLESDPTFRDVQDRIAELEACPS
jgi:tetratricopeptide (TPR) repeat protein